MDLDRQPQLSREKATVSKDQTHSEESLTTGAAKRTTKVELPPPSGPMKTRGQADYEADLQRRPFYHDGTNRKTWDQLGKVEKWSWERPHLVDQAPGPSVSVQRAAEAIRMAHEVDSRMPAYGPTTEHFSKASSAHEAAFHASMAAFEETGDREHAKRASYHLTTANLGSQESRTAEGHAEWASQTAESISLVAAGHPGFDHQRIAALACANALAARHVAGMVFPESSEERSGHLSEAEAFRARMNEHQRLEVIALENRDVFKGPGMAEVRVKDKDGLWGDMRVPARDVASAEAAVLAEMRRMVEAEETVLDLNSVELTVSIVIESGIPKEVAEALQQDLRAMNQPGGMLHGDAFRYEAFSKRLMSAEDGSPKAVAWAMDWYSELLKVRGMEALEQRIAREEEARRHALAQAERAAGRSGNPHYQAYLDTIEDPASIQDNVGFLVFMGQRNAEMDRLGKSLSAEDRKNFIRSYADRNLSERVKSERAVAQVEKDGSRYSNAEVATSEDLWREFYQTTGHTAFHRYTYEERLDILNRKFPEFNR